MSVFTWAFNGDFERCQDAIINGLNIDTADEIGATMLHYAAIGNQTKVVELLLKHGANINIQNEYGYTPLNQASYWGRIDIVRLLLEFGADYELRDIDGLSPKERCFVRDDIIDLFNQYEGFDIKEPNLD